MSTKDQKAALRRLVRRRRASMSPLEYYDRSQAIIRNLLQAPIWDGVRVVHCYIPLKRTFEPDIFDAIEELNRRGVKVVVPVAEQPSPKMSHVLFTPGEPMEEDVWGVRVPVRRVPVSRDRIDLVIVPLLAVDQAGYRLGYGKGYYDAFLKSLKVLKVGVCYSEDVLEAVPKEPHDEPVDWVVTDLDAVAVKKA